MPNLPTFSVTKAQHDRLLSVFESTDAYKEWLKVTLVDHVTNVEAQRVIQETQEKKLEEFNKLKNELLPPPTSPV